jgi:hypothetical protein
MSSLKNKVQFLMIAIIMGGAVTATVLGADLPSNRTKLAKDNKMATGPIVPNNWKFHKIGGLWQRVLNTGKMGDDAYQDRTPSCDYPGGSGNSYLYRGSVWLSAFVDGVYHCTKPEDDEYSPIDSVHIITGDAAISDEDTWTKYYDVMAPQASGHFPLGLEITEKTYAWSASYAGDFIIYEFSIKNVGIDSDGDGYPDTDRDLDDFYFTLRLDGDVSKLPTWAAEYRFSNQDDHAMANGRPWDWLEYFPQLAGYDHGLTLDQADSTMVMMFDGDNPNYPADSGEEDDFGNPGVDGKLQTPGWLGFKILKTKPYLKPSSFHVCHIYNDPANDQETWDRMVGVPEFEDMLLNPSTGLPHPLDYRGILTFGPLEKLAAGDSVIVTAALGVGSDPDSGGIYSLLKLMQIMEVAQFMADNDFVLEAEPPPAPVVEVAEYIENNVTTGIKITWDNLAETHAYFQFYKLSKGIKKADGSIGWQTLATYIDTAGSVSWPPPSGSTSGTYEYIDRDILSGFVYHYSVQAYTEDISDPIPLGQTWTQIGDPKSYRVISPANPEATATLDRVKVVPNPYIGSAAWNNPAPSDNFAWEHRIQFTNLPGDAKIKIFTLDGDYVTEIQANKSVVVGESIDVSCPSVAEWDLMTRNNQEAAPGIYMYVVNSPSLGEKVGKFVIVR